MNISEMVKMAHDNAYKKGFWEGVDLLGDEGLRDSFSGDLSLYANETDAINSKLFAIVSEIVEARTALRNYNRDNFREELADIVITTATLAGGLGIDLEDEIIKKMDKNRERPYKHNKAF